MKRSEEPEEIYRYTCPWAHGTWPCWGFCTLLQILHHGHRTGDCAVYIYICFISRYCNPRFGFRLRAVHRKDQRGKVQIRHRIPPQPQQAQHANSNTVRGVNCYGEFYAKGSKVRISTANHPFQGGSGGLEICTSWVQIFTPCKFPPKSENFHTLQNRHGRTCWATYIVLLLGLGGGRGEAAGAWPPREPRDTQDSYFSTYPYQDPTKMGHDRRRLHPYVTRMPYCRRASSPEGLRALVCHVPHVKCTSVNQSS